ncbi:hypothetical protein ACG33_06685 [Steroidobacter denitrificans]|uniref:Uncharacterized protein n=1 Tax=Steroidobacter denitrificans TaxID=465721 RepID=A0A127FB02_STEDE|nr:hypothetical protein ACG33_06685 [Steroidobacter denitrificans]
MDFESWPRRTRRLFSIDIDRWWKLRSEISLEVAVYLTVKPARCDALAKRINGLQELLTIEWNDELFAFGSHFRFSHSFKGSVRFDVSAA